MKEQRQMQVHPQIIFHLIESQAGTLGKALLEYVMNAVDALSEHVTVTVTQDGFVVSDEGIGFDRLEGIYEMFEILGFPHPEQDERRTYGRFGIGRAQGFSFASTVWRTGEFEMDIDIKARGLDYTLKKGLPKHKGCQITGTFYERMLPSEVDATVRELTELAMYLPIPLYLNGEQVSKDTAQQKWDHDTEEAWIKLREKGDLKVYNQGVLVRGYPNWQFGTGGVVVSKVPLQVNFARNDVLQAKCGVWKRLSKYLRNQTAENTKRKPRLTDAERENLAWRLRHGELDVRDYSEVKLFTDTTGRHWPLKRFSRVEKFTVAPEKGSRIAERVHQRGLAFVLCPSTLERFECESTEEFVSLVQGLLRQVYAYAQAAHVPFDTFKASVREGYDLIQPKELGKREAVALDSLLRANELVARIFREAGEGDVRARTLRVGASDAALAWTDGTTYIAIERGMLKLVNEGIPGFVRLVNLLVHEYCHDSTDLGSHQHDQAFYEKFHNVMVYEHRWLSVGQAVQDALKAYASALRRKGVKVNRKVSSAEDLEAQLEMFEIA